MAAVAAASLTVATLVASPAALADPPVAPDGGGFSGVAVTAEGSTLLAAGQGTVSASARNTTGAPLYNGTAVAVLPLGVRYVAGSARPGPPNAVGEPVIRPWTPDPDQPDQTAQVLIWSNVADLPVGAQLGASFAVTADNSLYPVGSSFTVDVGIYANSNPRIVPSVAIPADGSAPVVSRATAGGDASPELTVSALRLSKADQDAEAEVYRGPANATRYTLTVTTADEAGSDGVVVVDRVPAVYQVTDCELGAPGIACASEIVTVGGEVFTQLTWTLGDLPAGTTVALTYEAFIGLREITAPDGQATGAPTRPGEDGTPVTNTAQASAVYTGSVADGTSNQITLEASATVDVLDLGVVKSAASGEFFAGQTTTFSLAVRTSQFVSASGIVLVDTVPDGMCPLVPAGVPTSGAWPAECPAPGGGEVTGGQMLEAIAHPDGTFTVALSVVGAALDEDEDATIVYGVYMRESYQDGSRTTSGDRFTNDVEIEGTTEPVAGNDVDSGPRAARDDSGATLGTSSLSLTKTVWTNPARQAIAGVGGAGVTCASAPAGEYVASDGPRLQLGDLACFRIGIDFPDGISTRDAIVADFLPPGTELVDWAGGPGNSATIERLDNDLQWLLGDENPNGSRYVAPGATLVLDLLVRVTSVPDAGADIDITGNLAKLRYTSGTGEIIAARDEVDLTLAPIAPLSLVKRADGQRILPVQEEQVVDFTVSITHDGSAADGNDYPLNSVQVWDALPDGFGCADLGVASPAVADCAVAATGPAAGRAVVTWTLSGADLGPDGLLLAGETVTVSYPLTIPTPLSINSTHTNQAAVVTYTAPTTDGTPDSAGDVDFWPANPFDAYPDETVNAPEASDRATVTLAPAAVGKAVTATGITTAGNSALTQATIGESVDYAYRVTIPAHTSVFDGVLEDGLPLGGRLVQTADPVLSQSPDGVSASPGCTSVDDAFVLCEDGTLFFPAVWTNDTDAPAVFVVALPTRVADVGANANGLSIPNVATFRSAPAAGAPLVSQGTASASIGVVEPSPALAKTASASIVAGGQAVTYTLTATNAAGRPPLYDGVVVDCVPGVLAIGALPAGLAGPVAGDGSNGCPTGTQRLTWTLSGPLVAGTPQTASYPVTVPASAPAGQEYRNDAVLRGTSVPGEQTGERAYSASASRTVTVERAALTKTSSTATLVPGQAVTWTVTAAIPANVELFDAAFVDALPAPLSAVESWSLSCTGGDATWQSDCLTGTELTRSPATSWGVGLGTIAPSALTRTLTLTVVTRLPVDTAATQGTTLTNTAQLRWNFTDKSTPTSTADSWDTSTSATATTQVRHPQVTVTKAVSDTTPGQGETFTYTVTATTTAGARNVPAYNVSIVDTVPAGVVPLGGDGQPLTDGASTASGGVWNATARTLTWTVATLDPGAANAVTRTYPARLAPASALSGAALTNSVRPQSWTSLPTDGRSYGPGTAATASATPQFPRVSAAKTQVTPANPVYIGQEVTYRVELTNAGGATAVSLDAVDTLAANWSYVAGSAFVAVRSGSATAVEPVVSGQTLRWNDLGGATVSLQPGERIVITYRAVAGPSVAVGLSVPQTNTVTAADVTDSTGGTSYNGGSGSYIGTTGTATARIASADLRIAKVANDDFVAGGTGTYTVTVTNDGPDPAAGVTVTDAATLPAGVTLVGATGAGWSCSAPAGGDLSCARTNAADTLASGASWTLTVRAAVAADVRDGVEIPNSATVSARTEDRDPADNTDEDTAVVQAQADLRVVKTATVSPAVAGLPFGWTIVVTNDGPSVSRGTPDDPIVVSDVLPDEVDDVEVTSVTPGVTHAVGDDLEVRIPYDLAPGESVSITLAGVLSSDAAPGSTVRNTATVIPVTADPDPTNDSSTSATPVVVEESLTIDKSIIAPVPPDAVPGETLTYRLTVSNGGPSAARGVSVLDALPDGVTFRSLVAGASAWSATAVGDDVRFALDGTLPAGESRSFDILVDIAPGVTGDVTNTATVSSTWRADQDDASVTAGSTASADLAITKSVDAAAIVAGSATGATYTLTVDNLGPSDAEGPVVVQDLLPAGVRLAGPAPDGCSTADESGRQRVTCVKADGLDAAETPWSIALAVVVGADVTATSVTNTASASSPTTDPDPSNNTASITTPVQQRAVLSVVKDAPDAAVAGEDATWTVTVANAGPSDARDVVLADVFDPRLALVRATSDDDVTCTGTTAVSCAIGVLAAGGSVEIEVTTTVDAGVADGTVIPNAAVATSTTIDPGTGEPARAEDDAEVAVSARSALTIRKDAVSATVDAGGVASYTIDAGNDGPSDAASPVTLVDTLPAGQTFLAATTTGGPGEWEWSVDGQVVTAVLTLDGEPVSLAAGASAPTFVVSATVDPAQSPGTMTNTASISSPSSETAPTDDADVTVVTHADLELVKTHPAGLDAVAGDGFTWLIQIVNHGPSDSVAQPEDPIVIRDVLPAGATLLTDPLPAGPDTTCTVTGDQDGGQVVECLRTSTIPAGEALELSLDVMLDESASGDLTNTAAVIPGLTPEPVDPVWPSEDSDTVTVSEVADLAITKTAGAESVTAGGPVTWTIGVENLGPSDSDASASEPITVIDTLPLGVIDAVAAGDGWTCVPLGPDDTGREQISCTRDETLPVGVAPDITVTATVGSEVQGEIRNTAVVTPGLTPQPPFGPGPDEATATTPVTESADLALTKVVRDDIVAGGTGAYRLQIVNLGPSDAREVSITDTLPEGLRFDGMIGATEGFSVDCTVEDDPSVVVCALGERIPAGATITLDMEVLAAADLQGDIVNSATVTALTPDPDEGNNTSTVAGTVVEKADLAIVKTAVGDPVVGGAFGYALAVTNNGPSLARGLIVRDDVPAQLRVDAVTADGWSCVVAPAGDGPTAIVCSLTELAAGAAAPPIAIAVTVLPDAYPAVSNTAVVEAATPEDPDSRGDNTSTVTTPVPAASRLELTKGVSEVLRAGAGGQYTLTVTNVGLTPDPGPVQIRDDLPSGLAFVRATLDGAPADCDVTGQVVLCDVGALGIDQTAVLVIDVAVARSASGTIVNVATAISPNAPEEPEARADGVVDRSLLPITGGEALALLLLPFGLLLLLIGAMLVLYRRRRLPGAS